MTMTPPTLEDLEATIDTLRQQISAITAWNAEAQRVSESEIADLRAKNQRLTDENDALKSYIDDLEF
jgi:predicted  nucleic acid-binding Zn-ribbon protein